MRRIGIALALAVVALGACAKREPPSGGPPDIDPPRVHTTSPDSGAARVAPTTALSVTFSEGMEPRSTAEAIALAPRVDIAKRSWHGRTLTLVLAKPLEPNRTYTLFVGPTARDRHGNSMGAGSAVAFSTGETFPPGRIAGTVEGRGLSASSVAMWCYRDGHVPDSTARDFDAIGLADAEGRFHIDGLTVPASYRLWAFVDQNGNRSLEPTTDILVAVDTTFALTPERPTAAGFRVVVVNPKAAGTVRGAVLDSLRDSLGVVRIVATPERDSTRTSVADADPRTLTFELRLDPGAWWLRAYRDLDRSKSWQRGREPASERLRLDVSPAQEIEGVKLRLLPAASVRD